MTQSTKELIYNHRASMPTSSERYAEDIFKGQSQDEEVITHADTSPYFLIDDLDDLVQDEEVWTYFPPIRHGLEPITLASLARQIRRRHTEKTEREVRIAACVVLYYANEGTPTYQKLAWAKIESLFS